MTYVLTKDHVADLLTKSLPKRQFDLLVLRFSLLIRLLTLFSFLP